MRKIIIGIFLISIFILLINNTATAQQLSQSPSLQAYLSAQESYRNAENQYELKRSEYLKFGTLSSKNEAIVATRNFLIARDNLWLSYFTYLNDNLKPADLAITEEKKNEIAQKITDEVSFFNKQKSDAENANELEKLVEITRTTEERINQTESVSFMAVGEIKIARLDYQKNRIQVIINDLETKLGSIDENGDKNTSLARRWLTDSKSELAAYEGNINEAKEELVDKENKTSSSSKRSTFTKVQTTLDLAKENLNRSNKFLAEIIREVKTAD